MENTSKTNVGVGAMLGALSLFLVSQAAMLVNPALSSLAEKFPDVPFTSIQLASTLCSLMYVPTNIISGMISGKKVKYKTMALISLIVTTIGGVLPFFVGSSWNIILVCRALLGIGAGLGFPLGNAYIMQHFDSKRSASLQGLGSLTQNLAGFAFATIAGWVCMVNVDYVWLAHLILIIPIILVAAFIKEEDSSVPEGPASGNESATSAKLPGLAILYSVLFGLMFAVFYPLNLNVSAIMTAEGFGSAAAAGTALSMYTVGGILAGLVFGPMFKALKKWTFAACFVSWVIALFIGYSATNTAMFGLAIGLGGLAIFCVWPATFMSFAEFVPADKSALAAGIFSALLNVGAFLATPFTSVVYTVTGNQNPRTPILVGAIVTIVLAVVWVAAEFRRQANANK